MEGDELGGDLVRLDNGFLVDEETYTVVNSDDVLGKHLFFTETFVVLKRKDGSILFLIPSILTYPQCLFVNSCNLLAVFDFLF